MLDALVKISNVRNVTGFDPNTLLPTRQVQVTYMVGTHGPFILITPDDHFTDAYLEAETGKKVSVLKNAGAL